MRAVIINESGRVNVIAKFKGVAYRKRMNLKISSLYLFLIPLRKKLFFLKIYDSETREFLFYVDNPEIFLAELNLLILRSRGVKLNFAQLNLIEEAVYLKHLKNRII